MSKEGVCRIFRGNFIFDSFEDVEIEWMADDFNDVEVNEKNSQVIKFLEVKT